jgi:hypothetical protein
MIEPRAGQAGKQAVAKAGHVGVVADQAAVADGHGVDRAGGLGAGRKFVHQRHDRLLERIGDVEPGKALVLETCDRGRQICIVQSALGEIEQFVCQLQAEGAAFLFVQARRAGCQDGATK